METMFFIETVEQKPTHAIVNYANNKKEWVIDEAMNQKCPI